jgi:hypothetical protein
MLKLLSIVGDNSEELEKVIKNYLFFGILIPILSVHFCNSWFKVNEYTAKKRANNAKNDIISVILVL